MRAKSTSINSSSTTRMRLLCATAIIAAVIALLSQSSHAQNSQPPSPSTGQATPA